MKFFVTYLFWNHFKNWTSLNICILTAFQYATINYHTFLLKLKKLLLHAIYPCFSILPSVNSELFIEQMNGHFCNCSFLVVLQPYEVGVSDAAAAVGGVAVFSCDVPPSVAPLITVHKWTVDGTTYTSTLLPSTIHFLFQGSILLNSCHYFELLF